MKKLLLLSVFVIFMPGCFSVASKADAVVKVAEKAEVAKVAETISVAAVQQSTTQTGSGVINSPLSGGAPYLLAGLAFLIACGFVFAYYLFKQIIAWRDSHQRVMRGEVK